MNCANHPETPATAFCQYCGKPLCAQCVHKVGDIVSCEPCLAARVQGASTGTYNVGIHNKGFHYTASGPLPPGDIPPQPVGSNTWIILGLISWIPGVGAMYNGQLAKGIAHVIIFALLVDLTHYNGLLGLLVAAWVIYQVFDAYQTAAARRDGLPLPNPLGLNDIGHWFGGRDHGFGGRGHAPYPGVNPVAPNPPVPPPPPEVPEPGVAGPDPFSGGPMPGGPVSGFTSSYVPPPYGAPPIPPVPPSQYDMPDLWRRHGGGIPTGAIILIVLGVLFLLGNIGILSEHWLDRGWPILLIALGVWIVIRRSHTPPPMGGAR